MASPKVSEALGQIQSAADPAAAYETILSNLKSISTPQTVSEDLNSIIDHIFSNGALGIVTQRALTSSFVTALRGFENADLWVGTGTHALEKLSDQSSSFIEQSVALRELVADAHEQNEDNLAAARILAEIPLDASQRKVTNEDCVTLWIRIVRNYLEVDDTTAAETFLNKLKNVIYTVSDPALNLHFKLSQARIQDSKREFLSSSQAYHDISLSSAISEEERLHTLSMAVKCAILAPAGPLRSRALGRLFKDERSPQLDEFGMLEKMFFDRLLAPDEVASFAESLSPHQLATTADGSTVLARAVVEHNLLGASRLYGNIACDALGRLLGLDADRAEETTARMIEQGRLVGRIDQIEQVIYFDKGGEADPAAASSSAAAAATGGSSGDKVVARPELIVGKEMRQWDANVQGLAEEVGNVVNDLQREFPDFVAANLVV